MRWRVRGILRNRYAHAHVYLCNVCIDQVANPRRGRGRNVESAGRRHWECGRRWFGPGRVESSGVEGSRAKSSRVESSRKSPPLTSRRVRLQFALESCTTEHARVSRAGCRDRVGRTRPTSYRQRSTIDKPARFDLNHVGCRSIDVKLKRLDKKIVIRSVNV